MDKNEIKTARPSQEFVLIDKIEDGVLYMKGGGIRKLVMVNGINFDLKSEEEQNAILGGFQNFLNTLDFSMQFFIHSRKVNVEGYLQRMEIQKEKEKNELLKIQIGEYISFIRNFVEENDIITKSFFAVVPYEATQIVSQTKGLFGFFKKGGNKAEEEKTLQEKIQQLDHRVDQVISGLEQIGLRAAPLEDEELIELFYNLYNPELKERKKINIPN